MRSSRRRGRRRRRSRTGSSGWGRAYTGLLDDRDHLLAQLHGFAAAGDPEIREPVAACFAETFDTIARLIGGTRDEARAFVGMGMYLNIARALELPKEYTGEE